MTIKRIKVKETQHINVDLDGKLEDIIASLQAELDVGWEGIMIECGYYDNPKEVFPEKHSMNDDPSYWADKAFGDVVSAFCKEDN
jgi:hypothetical protein